MRKEIVTEKVELLHKLGVRFVTGTPVGEDIQLEALAAEFDAVFVGIGAWVGGRLGIEGEQHLQNVYLATEYLVRGNLAPGQLPSHLQSPPHLADDVVVIGGGDTSMDCVRTAVRLGAKRVTCVYRRTEAEMLGRAEERANAREEGVQFEYLTTPLGFVGNEAGEVTAVELLRMELGPPDESGRRRPIPLQGSNFTIPTGTVVIAIGYQADAAFMEQSPVEVNHLNLVRVDPVTHQTNMPNIFAGGDVVNGADLVVTAIADGQRAAAWMHRYLRSLDGKDGD
jgi:glutamate synthase (NADPH/NADH) small chain